MIVNKQVAVITGAASGIGLALTKVCALQGIHVVMADRVTHTLQSEAEQLRLSSSVEILDIVCDVTKRDDVEELAQKTFRHFNQVDILINNAGISGQLAPLWELTSQQISRVLEVNLYGVIHGVQIFLPFLFKQPFRSHIVNMASLYGLCSGSQMAAYAMSKHAIVALSESLYFDLKRLKKPVDVSVVCPSFANTSLLVNSAPANGDNLHEMINGLMERSRPVDDVASCIMREVKNKTFYILPDKEVKEYCEQRAQAIVNQAMPHEHSLEKIIASLSKRAADKR